ncbi:MutS-related protein [Sediminibacterium ginsengisoli]|uniref:MutS domain III n=1 Tax=Sediminibacterium ginsengisoli TaxID=413434 RepID=A0A1T4KBK5_9BACT|nr:hypothetical protein [Sediminibacterium ginsengisoli]SJZ39820.1 MutS domain III [Sediminibacterium ginsengisoli]
MKDSAEQLYRQREQAFESQAAQYVQRGRLLATLRFVLFTLAAYCLYMAFSLRFTGTWLWFALALLILFLYCVVISGDVKKKIAFLKQLVKINQNEIIVLQQGESFLDNGSVFGKQKGAAADLSVFGKHSLYHRLNRAAGKSGKQELAALLQQPHTDPAAIAAAQACVQELAALTDFRQELLAETLLLDESEAHNQFQQQTDKGDYDFLFAPLCRALAIGWPVLGFAAIGTAIWYENLLPVAAVTIFGYIVLLFFLRKINRLHAQVSKRSYLYDQYSNCFKHINAQSFQHPHLQSLKDDTTDAKNGFERLSRITGLFDLRVSLPGLILNGLFLLDLHSAATYMKWIRKYQHRTGLWLKALGEMEMLNSIASFHVNHPDFIFPAIDNEKLSIRAEKLGHPLMQPGTAVVNDTSIGVDEKLLLVTGSNMSGKSTFLRTVGLNLLLAQCGAPVFAASFVFSPMKLLTSFHHIDSLEESTSYFYAELKSLQSIMQELETGIPALVLLDEVMRGTNSVDKHDGTALLIRKLLQYNCLSLIATHDIELGILAERSPREISNYCFESELTASGLHFDFIMRPGVAQSRNATYLMQQMGIV